jgi:phosphoribosylformylglycinamidine synthase
VVGALGVIDQPAHVTSSAWTTPGSIILLVGQPVATIDGSEYLTAVRGREPGRAPDLDLDLERRVQAWLRAAIIGGRVRSAHDCSTGGLLVTLAESAMHGALGASVGIGAPVGGAHRYDELLFGEAASRVVIEVEPAHVHALQELADQHRVPVVELGVTGGDRLTVDLGGDRALDESIAALSETWRRALPRLIDPTGAQH